MQEGRVTRREFSTNAAIGAAVAGFPAIARPGRILGANDRVRTAHVGVRNRGMQVANAFRAHDDCEIVALCDIDAGVLQEAKGKIGGNVRTYDDYDAMLDNGDFDAVVIATPDHWHALQFIAAADLKKDVYVEKPLSMTIHEGRRMVVAAQRNNIVAQVGTQRRSSPGCIEATQRMRDGLIGKITVTRGYRISNMYPAGIGKSPGTEPPSGLQWDKWLGPRPKEPFNENIHPYKFRWHKNYSSQMGNWGVHFLDVMRWGLGVEAPTRVVAIGGKYAVDDDRDIPDTLQVTYEWPSGGIGVFGQYEANSGSATRARSGQDVEFRGTKGSLYLGYGSYEVIPAKGGQFQDPDARMEPITVKSHANTEAHTRNFLDCVKSREKCNADIEIGHRSTCISHIGNIALEVGDILDWDPVKERFTNNDQANALLHYEYRDGYTLG